MQSALAELLPGGQCTIDDVCSHLAISKRTLQRKLAETPIVLQSIEGTDIQIPEDSPIAFEATLEKTVESGDHYLYLCNIVF